MHLLTYDQIAKIYNGRDFNIDVIQRQSCSRVKRILSNRKHAHQFIAFEY